MPLRLRLILSLTIAVTATRRISFCKRHLSPFNFTRATTNTHSLLPGLCSSDHKAGLRTDSKLEHTRLRRRLVNFLTN